MTKNTLRKKRQQDTKEKTSTQQQKFSARYASIEKAAKIAEYYGFSLLPKIHVNRDDMHVAKELKCPFDQQSIFSKVSIEELSAMLRSYSEKKFVGYQQTPMFFYENHLPHESESSACAQRQLTLDIIGSSKSISDAALIHTAYVILTEEYKEEMVIELNSLGDRDSAVRYNRELHNYYKKFSDELPSQVQNDIKKNPILGFISENTKVKEISANAPQSISCLSENSRSQFKEVLEFMETLNMPYRINPRLIANRNIFSETIFTIRRANAPADEAPCAIGFRYNPISKKVGYKKEVPAARVVIYLQKDKIGPTKKHILPKNKKFLFYFVHIGFEAKLKSLRTLEILRQAKMPVVYSLIKDTLTHQLSQAEQCAVPYILLMGQKESIEHTVLVRTTRNCSQETVALDELPKHLKRLK